MEINCTCEIVHPDSSKVQCKIILSVSKENSVKEVKEIIENDLAIQCSEQELKFGEQALEDERPLSDYGIQNESTIQLLIKKCSQPQQSDTETEAIMPQRNEVSQIRQNYCKLVEVISEPAKLAAKLYSAELITAEMRDSAVNESHPSCGRTMRLVSAVEGQIKAFPDENFRKFLKILCEESCYQQLAKSIHPELAEECIQEIKNTEMLSELGKALQNIETETMLPVTAMDHVQQGSLGSSTPLLTLEEVRTHIREFEKRFKKIVYTLKKELRQQVTGEALDMEEVKTSITLLPNTIKLEYKRFLDKMAETQVLGNCSDIEQLFVCLNNYWSFFDYSLIEPLIEEHGSKDLQQKMQEYVKDMTEFRQKTVVETFAQVWIGDRDNLPKEKFTTLTANLKKDPAHCTLEELDRLRKEFCAAYHLSESALMFNRCRRGSVIIEWLLPRQLMKELLSTIKRVPIEVFCISRDIGCLCVGEQKVYSDVVFEEITVQGQYGLIPLLNKTKSECLNALEDHPYTDALIPGPLQYLQSDVDEQLIVFFTFKKSIKLHSIQISGPLDGRSPKTVRLFINQINCLDFTQAGSSQPVQEFVLTESYVQGDSVIPLDLLKYRDVSSLTIFIKDNQGGGDQTVVHHIGLFGHPVEAIDMSQFQRVCGDEDDEHPHAWTVCPHDRM